MTKRRPTPPSPIVDAVADHADAWAAILRPVRVVEPLLPDEKTIAMVAAETGKSEKMAGDLLRARKRDGLLTVRRVRVAECRNPVLAYRPVTK